MRILAVGDIHTKTWIIDKVESIAHNYDAVVFCGDYADNWNAPASHTIATWRLLRLVMRDNPKIHAVTGNHDYAYLHREIAGRSSGFDPITYALINTPENKLIKEWLLSLPVTLELDGITFSHAGVTEEWNGEETLESLWDDVSPIWARPKEMGGRITYKNTLQVIGHNTSKEIWNPQKDIWCVDTFSEHPDNTPAGDETVLEIIDAKQFNVIKLNENNSNITDNENKVS